MLLAEIISQLSAAGWMPQLAQRFRLNLANALTCHTEMPADLFKRVILPVFQPEAHLQDFTLAVTEHTQYTTYLLLEKLAICLLNWTGDFVVFDEIAKQARIFLTN